MTLLFMTSQRIALHYLKRHRRFQWNNVINFEHIHLKIHGIRGTRKIINY